MDNIKGKNVLVTGGSRGLGLYIARWLAREGVNLALTARSEDALGETVLECTRLGAKAIAYPADITDQASRETLVEQVISDFGSIDILVNNAGVEWVAEFASIEPDDIQAMVMTNLLSPMMLTRLVLPGMLKQGSGHILNMSSLGGKKGSPYSATYAATKAGLIQWTAGIREELHDTGVSASVICPGFVSEAGMFAVYKKSAPKIVGETTPEKVAEAVLKAIKKDVCEIIVNPGPIKPMMFLDVINPEIGSWLLRKFGVYKFYHQQAIDNEAQRK